MEGGVIKQPDPNESIDDTDSSDDDRELFGLEKGEKRSFALIYPDTAKYVAKDESRIFHMPPSLREGLLAGNDEVFNHAFHDLDKVTHLHRHQKVHDHHKQLKKQKTTLIGLPKQMAHEDPVQMFRNKRLNLVQKYGRGDDKSIPKQSSVGSRSRRDSIQPRELPGSSQNIRFLPGKTNQVHPFDEQLRDRTKSIDNDSATVTPNEHGFLPPITEKENRDHLSVIKSSEASGENDLEYSQRDPINDTKENMIK